MAVKRKSNWYIYLFALIISFVLLGFFVGSIWPSLFPDDDAAARYSVSKGDYRPSADINLTSLIMLSDMKAATPAYYMLMNYQPRNELIVFIPMHENTKVNYGGNSGSLYEMYDNFGAKAVLAGIEDLLGIECAHYIKFDRLSFIDFIDMCGEVTVNIPADVVERRTENVLEKYKVTDELSGEEREVTRQVKKVIEDIIFPEGSQRMDGAGLYDYLTYDFDKGEDYTLAVQGSAAMSLLNKNFRNMTSTQMQGLTETIISSTETDILFADYTAIQAVFSYTSENSINPSEYYIPYGVHDGGYFILSDAAKETMLDRMGITEEMLEKMKKN